MDITNLMTQAKAINGCKEGLNQLLESKNVDDLIQCFYDRIDYCLSKNFPSLTYLKHHREDLRIAGVYIDEDIKLHNESKVVLLGACNALLTLTQYAVSRVYVKGKSKLHLYAKDNVVTIVDALDDSNIIVEESDKARVIVNLYGKAKCTGASQINKKNKLTYLD